MEIKKRIKAEFELNPKLQALAQDERFAAIKDMENTLYQKLLEKAGD